MKKTKKWFLPHPYFFPTTNLYKTLATPKVAENPLDFTRLNLGKNLRNIWPKRNFSKNSQNPPIKTI